MKIEDILALTKAGFTKDDIVKLAASDPAPAQAPAQAEPAKTDPAPEKTETKADSNADVIKAITDSMDALGQKMEYTIKQFNLQNAEQKKPESVDDIIASIINPPKAGQKEGK